jgi:SAM-dependent methyltransferase
VLTFPKKELSEQEKKPKKRRKITYYASDFRKLNFEKESFDVILFSSSLHHFEAIDELLKNDISSLLHKNGLLVVFEFSGPNRLQWKKHQLKAANELLYEIPKNYRLLYDRKTLKKKVYRPGLIRMYLVDPSEAPDSANLVKAIHNNFSVIEESMLGWNLLHLALKGISHNFLNNKDETKKLIQYMIQKENEYVAETGESDAVFGVYQKK